MKDNTFLCLYVSDLHINKKKKVKCLLKRKIVDYQQIESYFQDQIQNLIKTIPTYQHDKIRIFIVGDVTDNFDLFQRFFNIYQRQIKIKTYFILGNHEFKGLFYKKKNNYPQIVEHYRKFLKPLKIELLEDELVVENVKQQKIHKYQIQEVMKLSPSEIKAIFANSSFSVLGSFNDSEISQVHYRLKKIVPNIKLIICTHLPLKNCLLKKQINTQWVYLYGHTHHNVKIKNFCYADNQIGVQKELKFKSFNLKIN